MKIRISGVSGPAEGIMEVISEQGLTLGRNPGNDLVIADGAMSGQHARLVIAGETLQIHDCNSTNGVFVNNAQISFSALNRGDHFSVGQSLFRVDYLLDKALLLQPTSGASAFNLRASDVENVDMDILAGQEKPAAPKKKKKKKKIVIDTPAEDDIHYRQTQVLDNPPDFEEFEEIEEEKSSSVLAYFIVFMLLAGAGAAAFVYWEQVVEIVDERIIQPATKSSTE